MPGSISARLCPPSAAPHCRGARQAPETGTCVATRIPPRWARLGFQFGTTRVEACHGRGTSERVPVLGHLAPCMAPSALPVRPHMPRSGLHFTAALSPPPDESLTSAQGPLPPARSLLWGKSILVGLCTPCAVALEMFPVGCHRKLLRRSERGPSRAFASAQRAHRASQVYLGSTYLKDKPAGWRRPRRGVYSDDGARCGQAPTRLHLAGGF